MGEVRKRKNSDSSATNGKAEPAKTQSGGLGLISVVFISAVLAGSGCHIIKKDTAENIKSLSSFVDELKAKNSETVQLVDSLRIQISTKDALIETLKTNILKNEDQAKELNGFINKLNDKLDETDAKIKDEVDVKYQDNLRQVRDLAEQVQKASSTALDANNKMDKTDKRMDDLKAQLMDSEAAATARTNKVAALEAQLSQVKTEAESKLSALSSMLDNLPQGVQDDLAAHGAEIQTFTKKLSELDARVSEQNQLVLDAGKSVAKIADSEETLKSTINGLKSEIEGIKNEAINMANKIPSEVTLVKIQTQAQKVSDELDSLLSDVDSHGRDIAAMKQNGEKRLEELNDKVSNLQAETSSATSSVKKIQEELKSSSNIVTALSNDIEAIKKRQADIVKSKAGPAE